MIESPGVIGGRGNLVGIIPSDICTQLHREECGGVHLVPDAAVRVTFMEHIAASIQHGLGPGTAEEAGAEKEKVENASFHVAEGD